MPVFLAISKIIDKFNTYLGRGAAMLILVAIVVSSGNAVVRKLVDTSSNAWLEMQWMLFGAVFLLCAPWTLLINEHIRVDILVSNLEPRKKLWIDIFGHLVFLLPFCIIIIATSIPFAVESFRLGEQSSSAGGLAQWPAKFLIPIGFCALLLQSVSELIKRVAALRGDLDEALVTGSANDPAEEAERLLLDAGIQQNDSDRQNGSGDAR
jgi:TRAP-type mannitol/chloroaromatic compound transport system permease small subunit